MRGPKKSRRRARRKSGWLPKFKRNVTTYRATHETKFKYFQPQESRAEP